jgi:fatty acyl-ACP thioesterase A
MNRHVNNASYIEWILDDVPSPVFETAFMSGLDIEYRSECKAGDEIDARSALALPDGTCLVPGTADAGPCTQPLTFQHALLRPSDGNELLRARTQWMPREQALADGAKLASAAMAAAAAAHR